MQRRAKVFLNNRSQAVRLPKEFQFTSSEVFIRKVGTDVVLSPRLLTGLRISPKPQLPRQASWRVSRIFPSRAANLDGALYARYRHQFVHHEERHV